MQTIQPQELRIGNYLYDSPFLKTVCEVTAVNPKTVKVKFKNTSGKYVRTSFPIKYLEPIPLTQDILVELGFKNGGYDFLFWYKDGLEFSGINWADEDLPEYQFLNFKVENDKIIHIHYVHQLQNLYYSLTGEELTIKEEI